MPTGRSWTEQASPVQRLVAEAVRASRDVGHLVAFRATAVRGRGRGIALAALILIGLLTLFAAWLPAYLPGAAGTPAVLERFTSRDIAVLLPSAYLGVLAVSLVSAAATGGGRELVPRDQAVAFPVSPTTDHLGALLMAPLNIAWLFQSWAVLAMTAFVVGPHHLLAAQVPVLLWLAVATSLAQLASWTVEWLRRSRRGLWLVRGLYTALAVAMAGLIATDTLVPVLDRSFTLEVLLAVLDGRDGVWLPWAATNIRLLLAAAAALVLGAVMAHTLARRPPREETRVESALRSRRPNPASDLAAVLRLDRAGVWRSVPLRRGFATLALLPGLVALASALPWHMLTILPGLVASAGALLFGVNSWALDARGALWRESLPATPGLAFTSRVLVLLEVLLVAVGLALALGAVRAGAPTASQAVAVLCVSLVVTLQVTSAAMRWSVRRPYADDLRSARATPAPPLAMVGYSTRLTVVTTFTGMLFMATSQLPDWRLSVLLAVPLLLFSLLRLARSASLWARPQARARVVTAVAG